VGALTPIQRERRQRVEQAIRLAAPVLDLVLAAGERLSRLVEREDHDYHPPQRGTLPPPLDEPPLDEPPRDSS
jgi:hypothetical protein